MAAHCNIAWKTVTCYINCDESNISLFNFHVQTIAYS